MSAPKPRPTTLKTIEAKKRAEEVAGLNAVGDANLGDVIESALVEELGNAIGINSSEQENRKRYGAIIDKKGPNPENNPNKKGYVRPDHLMDRPFRGNEGLLALKAQLEADAPKSSRRR